MCKYDEMNAWHKFKIKALGKVVMMLVISTSAFATSHLSGRLDTPSKVYANVSNSLFVSIERVGGRLLSVGERGLIAYSDDQGKTWVQAKVPVSNALTALHFIDSKKGWAVGHGGVILHSKNGGQTWVKQFDGNLANQLILEKIKQKIGALKQAYDTADELAQEDLLYEIEDAEFSLSDAEFDMKMGPANPFLDVWFENDQIGYVIGAYGFFFITHDGGETWTYAADRLDNIDRYHLNAIQKIKDGALVIAGEAGTLFASFDQGVSWETLYGPYQGSFFGIQPTQNAGEVLIYGLRGNIFKSSDNCQSWEQIESPVSTSLAGSSLSDEGLITLVGFSGTVLTSKDNGQSFAMHERLSLDAYNAVETLNGRDLVIASDNGIKLQ